MTDEGAAVERLRLGYIQTDDVRALLKAYDNSVETALRQRDRLVARAEAAEAEPSVACGMVTQYQSILRAAEAKLARIAEYIESSEYYNHQTWQMRSQFRRILNEGTETNA